jgi:hypothetical protein
LENTQTLETIAEVAIALAGFSGIVAVMGQRSSGEWSPAELTRLRLLLEVSLLVVFLSFLPALMLRGTSPIAAWRISSGVCGLAHLLPLALYFVRWRRLGWQKPVHEPTTPLFFNAYSLFLATGGLVISLLQLMIAVGLTPGEPSLIYEISLLWLLGVGAVQFIYLLLYRSREA